MNLPRIRWMQIFDVYLDLGLLNIAENALTDCLEALGDRPMVLKRLALINMVKANYPANGGFKSEPSVAGSARVYLKALSKTLFDADWADYYLARLKSDPDLSEDKEIQRLRSLCLQEDFGYTTIPVEKMLLRILEKNKQNRMAFEYLMAWYMLNKLLQMKLCAKWSQNSDVSKKTPFPPNRVEGVDKTKLSYGVH